MTRLIFTAGRRFAKGFSLPANHSQSIDNGSANNGGSVSHANPFNNGYDKEPPDFDHTRVFTLSGLDHLSRRATITARYRAALK